MRRTFGRRIEQFVMSNDIMDEDLFYDLMGLMARYLEKDLGISQFALLMEGIVDNKPGLETKWSMSDLRSSYSLPENPDDGYENCSTYCFGKNVSIWAVKHGGPDSPSQTWVDLWSNSPDLPTDRGIGDGVRTIIRHPVKRDGLASGVVELASEKYVEPTPVSRDEVTTLTEVIERSYRKMAIRKLQRANTRNVIQQLEQALSNETWARLALPQIFVAFSAGSALQGDVLRSHEMVVSKIREVVGEFGGVVDAVFWDESEESGNISAEVIRQIGLSEFGICYFSEPDQAGEFEYRDNPNVLFEAGMMQALQNSSGALLRGWIPVREDASPTLPFDIAAERILIIKRTEDTDYDSFALALRKRIEKLIEREGIEPSIQPRESAGHPLEPQAV